MNGGFQTKHNTPGYYYTGRDILRDHRVHGSRRLDECGIKKALGIIVVAIKRKSGDMELNPSSNVSIKYGDTLVVMGEPKKLNALEEMVGV